MYYSNFLIKTYENKINSNYIINKDQYKVMRKGISNMIKLYPTSSVSIPTDTRIQLITVSKDIIHSWSIPSAGIKIDCIPGYSSHKVSIFFLSGVYWGQCMEICGRFHHWMPIVIYFIKRDLFVLWCNHFITFNKNSKNINKTIKNINKDFNNIICYDKNRWINNI